MQEVICHYCSEAAILSFDDNGTCCYVCSAEHYHLHFRKQSEQAIKTSETTRAENYVISAMPQVSPPEIANHIETSRTAALRNKHKQIGALNG